MLAPSVITRTDAPDLFVIVKIRTTLPSVVVPNSSSRTSARADAVTINRIETKPARTTRDILSFQSLWLRRRFQPGPLACRARLSAVVTVRGARGGIFPCQAGGTGDLART